MSYFLSQNLISWPSKYIVLQSERKDIEEVIEVLPTNTVSSDDSGISKTTDYNLYDTLNRWLRITGCVSRFKSNILAKSEIGQSKSSGY